MREQQQNKHKRYPILVWVSSLILLATSGCSSIIGPHHIEVESGNGVKVVHLKGYGCNSIFQYDTAAIHLGWFERTLVFDEHAFAGKDSSGVGFGFYSSLPSSISVYQSVVDIGACAAWEPLFRGFSLGFQSRSLSRLPLNESLIFEAIRTNGKNPFPQFSLQRIP